MAAAARDPQAFETIIQYLKDSATWWVWSQVCQCNASGSPGCITFLKSHSANLPSSGTGSGIQRGYRFITSASGYTLWGLWIDSNANQTLQIYWMDIPTTVDFFQTVTLVPGWNQVFFTSPLTLVPTQTYQVGWRTTSGSASGGQYYLSPGTDSYSSPFVYSSSWIGPWDFSINSPSVDDQGIDAIICVGSPATYAPSPPPIPVTTLPDVPASACTTVGDLCKILNPMVDQIALLKQRLDLIQRRLLPFAWIAGTPVTGLTGHGQLTIQDVLGCIVTLTTVPGGWGSTAETPRRLIPTVGSLQASDGTNYDDWRQIHYEHELYIFGTPWATKLNYNFRSGVVATIVPIRPEP